MTSSCVGATTGQRSLRHWHLCPFGMALPRRWELETLPGNQVPGSWPGPTPLLTPSHEAWKPLPQLPGRDFPSWPPAL